MQATRGDHHFVAEALCPEAEVERHNMGGVPAGAEPEVELDLPLNDFAQPPQICSGAAPIQ